MGLALFLVVGLIVAVVVVVAIQRSISKGPDKGDGADIVAYLVLALSMGVAGFALARLASTAFPGESFVFDPAEDLATSLAALVVSTPFLVYFWRRQGRRRVVYPSSTGWTIYLSLMELVFMSSFVITAVMFVNGLISEAPAAAWTSAVVFGAIVVFHEYAARLTPPLSEAGELRRVFGSAIGLVPLAVGLVGVLAALFDTLFGVSGDQTTEPRFHPFVALIIVAAPVWAYRWLKSWLAPEGAARLTWVTIVSVASMATTLGAATAMAVLVIQYLFAEVGPSESHFSAFPVELGLVVTGLVLWATHRRVLTTVRGPALAVYRYGLAALGLAATVAAATGLTIVAFSRDLIVGGGNEAVIAFATVLVVGIVVWLTFERLASSEPPETERAVWPRRLYTLGLGAVLGLVSAGSLITVLFIFLRRLLDGTGTDSVLEPAAIFVFSGLGAWYLLVHYARDRGTVAPAEVITPFEVTLICSHPGMIATRFPDVARLRVLYRGDDLGVVDDAMADEIVAAVANRPSLVWVGEDGFHVAPMRVHT